jgi:hypothetical protein
MMKLNSARESNAERPGNLRLRFVPALSNHPIMMTATIFMLAVCFTSFGKAYAQSSQDSASCIEKCKADEKTCIHNGSSEELCDYDSKQCQKACSEGK